ncbi:MAG: regulator of RNase E activity RraA [Candidatus Poriferisodalaceae bacterium]|jgi:regulator of RNase E activity RraA|tara:strand:- start:755 stop:1450 length:696 start_codon:yes stop_codon:yes gene_type:complete
MLDGQLVSVLQSFDTPTICNALEIVAPERRTYGFTIEPFYCRDPSQTPMVGFARTATVRAMEPSSRNKEDDLSTRVGYYQHIAGGPGPTVTVIQDIDSHVGFGAHWGEVNSNLHRGLGSVGVVTNGSIRDIDDWAEDFRALAGSVGPSHAWIHVVEYDISVEVHGMKVAPGDLIHADQHGAVVIPLDVATKISGAVDTLIANEAKLIGPSKDPSFNIEQLVELLDPAGHDH